jgi:alkanesulfonate monooxygenase SsuD/methylene tetrahydromethanopterin reductase-like flavin-dependent oxidoreductase (luciferase family)
MAWLAVATSAPRRGVHRGVDSICAIKRAGDAKESPAPPSASRPPASACNTSCAETSPPLSSSPIAAATVTGTRPGSAIGENSASHTRRQIAAAADKAWDECEAGLHQVLNFYRMRVNSQAGSIGSGALQQLPPVGEFRNVPGIGHGGAPFAVGTPETVAEMLSAYRDKRLTHLVLTFHAPGMASEAVRRSMRAFARDIMPAIAAW